jgi:hypothetical protein
MVSSFMVGHTVNYERFSLEMRKAKVFEESNPKPKKVPFS